MEDERVSRPGIGGRERRMVRRRKRFKDGSKAKKPKRREGRVVLRALEQTGVRG